jgi:LCP family protein required for cell wall assembly
MKGKETSKKRSVLKIFVSVIVVLFAIVIIGYSFILSKLDLLNRTPDNPSESISSSESVEIASENDHNDQEMLEATAGLEEREAILATGDIFSDSDVFNILLIGTDERTEEFNSNARGDACMLFSINKSTGVIHLVSFERGMGVPILEGQYAGQYDWLTHTFRYGGADLMMKEIRECFKVDVTHYVRVNFNTFIQGINAIGGVDINLTQAEVDYILYRAKVEGNGIEQVSVGLNHMNGATALCYARCRKIDSDWKRISRQRTVIQAAVDQVKNLNILELNNMLDTVLPLIQTNLTNEEILSLAMIVPLFWGNDFEQATIPLSGTYGSMKGMGGRSLFSVDFDTNAKALQEMLYGDAE